MTHIIHINPSYKPAWIYGGPTHSVSQLCERLTEIGVSENHTVEVLTTTANGKKELSVPTNTIQIIDGVQVTYFKRFTKDHSHFSPDLINALRTKINQRGKNNVVVHIHAWWNLVSVLSAFTAYIMHVKYVISPRGMLTNYSLSVNHSLTKRLFQVSLGRRLLKNAIIHTTSDLESVFITKLLGVTKLTTIYNLVEFPSTPELQQRHPKTEFRLIFMSRIDEKKGIEFLLNAISKCTFKWELTIAGSGSDKYLQYLKSLCVKLNISNSIKWVGHIENSQKFKLIRQHDLLCLTSYNENFANIVIESLSQGTAVLLSDKVGVSNFVAEHDLGWIAKLNPDHITKQINMAYNDTTKRNRIRKDAYKIIEYHFDNERLIKQYLALYNQLISHK